MREPHWLELVGHVYHVMAVIEKIMKRGTAIGNRVVTQSYKTLHEVNIMSNVITEVKKIKEIDS